MNAEEEMIAAVPPGGPLVLRGNGVAMDCGGRAQRRHRFGFFRPLRCYAGSSKAVWRWRFPPQSMEEAAGVAGSGGLCRMGAWRNFP